MRVEERVWFLSESPRSVTCSVQSSFGWSEGRERRQIGKRRQMGTGLTGSGHRLDLGQLSPSFLWLGVSL